MKCLILGCMVACALGAVSWGSTVVVDTLRAGEIQTREITSLPAAPDGLVLHYAFEEDYGNTVLDSGTNGYDAVASGCTWSNDGPFNGGSMSFFGNASKIPVPYVSDLPAWNRFTISIWFLHDGGGDFGNGYGHKIFDKTSMYHDWYLRILPYHSSSFPGQLNYYMYENNISRGMGDTRNFMDNAWHHVVVVQNGANGQLWIDGILEASAANLISVTSSSSLCIGNSLSSDSFQRKGWSGKLDEFQIYNRPLSGAEITNLYTIGKTTPDPPVSVTSDLVVEGDLTVTGGMICEGGIRYLRPLGDLSSGIYTNTPAP